MSNKLEISSLQLEKITTQLKNITSDELKQMTKLYNEVFFELEKNKEQNKIINDELKQMKKLYNEVLFELEKNKEQNQITNEELKQMTKLNGKLYNGVILESKKTKKNLIPDDKTIDIISFRMIIFIFIILILIIIILILSCCNK